MKKRYDYRRDYKGWTIEQITKHIPKLEEELLKNIGICQSNADNCLKRLSYLKNKIK
jgi:hypothetical protein